MSSTSTFKALCYLHIWEKRRGSAQTPIAHEAELRKCDLDYSVNSLGRVDAFLEALHARLKPDAQRFVGEHSNVNFIYFLAFYTGEVLARAMGAPAVWMTYREALHISPELAKMTGPGLHSAMIMTSPAHLLPLKAICARLFAGSTEESLRRSVGAVLPPNTTGARLTLRAAKAVPLDAPLAPLAPMDFGNTVDAARRTLRANPRHPLVPPSMPVWARNDPISALFDVAKPLYEEGRVVWGAVIQANNELFQPYAISAPGEVLYDPRGYAPRLILRQMADYLYALRHEWRPASLPPKGRRRALLNYHTHLNAEVSRFFNWQMPLGVVPYPLTASTTYFDCDHLPGGALTPRVIMPLLVHDAYPGFVLPLPEALWPSPMRDTWLRQLRGDHDAGALPEPENARPIRPDHPQEEPAILASVSQLLASIFRQPWKKGSSDY